MCLSSCLYQIPHNLKYISVTKMLLHLRLSEKGGNIRQTNNLLAIYYIQEHL